MDETGTISGDRFFGLGLLKTDSPSKMLDAIRVLRDQKREYGEIKFTKVTQATLPFYRAVVDACLVEGAGRFFCFMADREVADPIAQFRTPWVAYGKLAEQLVIGSLRPDELVTVLADDYSTPKDVQFEDDLRRSVNKRLRRLAVVSVCRFDSRSTDGIQAADLLTGAIAFEFRAKAGFAWPESPRGELATYVREKLGADSSLTGWRNERHSVAVYRHRGSPLDFGAGVGKLG